MSAASDDFQISNKDIEALEPCKQYITGIEFSKLSWTLKL